jgi:hypothetical protein
VYRFLPFAALACVCACLPGACLASETAKLHVQLTPERLGAGTTIVFSFQISGDSEATGVPSPLRAVDLSYPAGFGLGTSGLGLESCTATTLEADGPRGCPADSAMGYGSAMVDVPFGQELVEERADIDMFMAPVDEGQVEMVFFASALTPIHAELVFPAMLATAAPPAGGSLNTSVPLVPTLPDAPDAAVVRLTSTIGPLNLTYYEQLGGRNVAYKPRGVVLPKACPRSGFPFKAVFDFEDGTRTDAAVNVPCPHRA